MFSIYIHIPFCLKKCGYCDFFSKPVSKKDVPFKKYIEAIKGQLQKNIVEYDLKNRQIGSIYFGGGTPSLMPPAFFEELLTTLSGQFSFSPNVEVTSEVNPATVDLEWFRSVEALGLNRISIGVQTFNEELLKILGRVHTKDDAMRTIAEAQDAGFKSVNVDLMYAIPNETVQILEDDLKTVMTFQPEHISAYQLTLEEGTPLYNSLAGSSSPSEDSQLQQMRIVARVLERSGFPRYEISNYAKKGFECRHNLNYWRYGEYLGLGAGATSFIDRRPQTTDPGLKICEATRFTQVRNIDEYLSGSEKLGESEEISPKMAMGEFCFMGLRMMEGISTRDFEEKLGESFECVYKEALKNNLDEGLLEKSDERIKLTPKGIEFSNQVFADFVTIDS